MCHRYSGQVFSLARDRQNAMEIYAEALQVQGLLALSVLDDRHDASHIRVY